MDFSIRLSGGQILRGMIDSPGDNAKAGVMLVHGLGEHVGRYSHWVRKFSAGGIAFAGVDLPGHGKSDGKRGYIKNYGITSEMLYILINEYRKTFTGLPLFLYGHSLGGGIILEYLIRKNPVVAGAIITSPFLKLSFEPPKAKILLAGIMKNIMPSLTQPSGLVADHLSHDASVVEKYKNDPLVHDKISVSLFHSALAAADFSLSNSSLLGKQILLMHGSDDMITSPDGSRKFAADNDKVKLKIWDGGYHELHNEPFKDDVFSFIISWMHNLI